MAVVFITAATVVALVFYAERMQRSLQFIRRKQACPHEMIGVFVRCCCWISQDLLLQFWHSLGMFMSKPYKVHSYYEHSFGFRNPEQFVRNNDAVRLRAAEDDHAVPETHSPSTYVYTPNPTLMLLENTDEPQRYCDLCTKSSLHAV